MESKVRQLSSIIILLLVFSVFFSITFIIATNGSGSDLVGYWKFDEGSGSTASDSSGNGNDGDIYASGRNQISNPSFESDIQGWGSDTDWQIVTNEKWHSSKSAFFEDFSGDDNSNATDYVYIPVTDGETITISLYSKGDNVQVGSYGWHKAYVLGRWINSTGHRICCADMSIGDGTGTWDWKRSSAVLTAPVLTPPDFVVSYQIYLGLIGTGTGTLWVDAVQVEYGNTLTSFTDSAWTTGKFGSALEFDGIDDYVSHPYITDIEQGNFTWIAWVNASDIQLFGGNIYVGSIYNSLGFGVTPSQLRMHIRYSDDSTDSFTAGANILDNQWHFLAYQRAENTLKIFKDGTEIGSKELSKPLKSGNSQYIGTWHSTYGYFTGKMDEVKIYDRALTEGEIKNEYLYGIPELLQIKSLYFSTALDQININWVTEYEGATVYVECKLNDVQNCDPFPYSGEPGGGGCTIQSPSYDMTPDPGVSLRTNPNTIYCNASDPSDSSVYDDITRIFYPISFEVLMPTSMSSVVGEKQDLIITIKNNGTLSDTYGVTVTSNDPGFLIIENGAQTTESLSTNDVQQIYVDVNVLTSEVTTTADMSISSDTSKSYTEIKSDQTLTVRGGLKSLPDFGFFGIIQIMFIAAVAFVSFLF